MLHLMGGLCVIAGSAVVGLQLVVQRRRRLEEWKQVLFACRLMERELRCREPNLSELLDEAARQSGGAVGSFFAGCRSRMGELGSSSFVSIWRENLDQANLCLRRQEKDLLAGLGAILGRYDRESQCAALNRVAVELESQLREEDNEAQKRNKLYMTLSIAGGMLLVVLAC